MAARILHCWKDKADHMQETYGPNSDEYIDAFLNSGTCMLEKDHTGDHIFTDDNDISIEFKELDPV